jgi:hypothetical protein
LIDAMVDRDAIQPCLQARFASETREVLEGFDEDVLRKVHRIIAILDKAIADPIDLPFVTDHDFIKRRNVPSQISFDKTRVLIQVFKDHWE